MVRPKLLLAGELLSLLESLADQARARGDLEVVGPVRRADLADAIERLRPDALLVTLDERLGTPPEAELVQLLGGSTERIVIGIDPAGDVALRILLVSRPTSVRAVLDLVHAAFAIGERAPATAPAPERELSLRELELTTPERTLAPPDPPDPSDPSDPSGAYGDDDELLEDELRWLELVLRAELEALNPQLGSQAESRAAVRAILAAGERGDAGELRAEIDRRVALALAEHVDLRLERVRRGMQLDPFERACLVLVLGATLRPSIVRALDVLGGGRARITSELCMRLFGPGDDASFGPSGRLRRSACVIADGAAAWKIDPALAAYIVEGRAPIGECAGTAARAAAATLWSDWDAVARVARALRAAVEMREPGNVLVTLAGESGSGRLATCVRALDAAELFGFYCDVEALLACEDFELALRRFVRCARLGGVLVFVGFERLLDEGERAPARLRQVEEALAENVRIAILVSTREWSPEGPLAEALHVRFAVGRPRRSDGARIWAHETELADWELDQALVNDVGARFRLRPADVRRALRDASARAFAERGERVPARAELFAACRRTLSRGLEGYAERIEPHARWRDLVLSPRAKRQLEELVAHVECAPRVLDEWQFDSVLARGRGVAALFGGPSGTGKTMAAEAVAGRLGLELWRIDLARILSKYIGETEAHLREVFERADENSILFFDEADALFGKRTEVRDAHDRYANVEVAYLLQLVEDYAGVAILATNLRGNMDDAFLRRLRFVVDFTLPDAKLRERIWRHSLPRAVPVGADVDFAFLARRLEVSGGSIRNIGVAAAFHAARAGASEIGMAHFVRAAADELEKLGRPLDVAAFRPHEDCLKRALAPVEDETVEAAS